MINDNLLVCLLSVCNLRNGKYEETQTKNTQPENEVQQTPKNRLTNAARR